MSAPAPPVVHTVAVATQTQLEMDEMQEQDRQRSSLKVRVDFLSNVWDLSVPSSFRQVLDRVKSFPGVIIFNISCHLRNFDVAAYSRWLLLSLLSTP